MLFTEYIHHVGNASEMNSIIRSGLIPGARSPKRGRQSVFFTMTNPMEKDDNGMGETPCDLTSQGSLHTKILGNCFQTLFIGAILKLAQGTRLQFYQTRSHAIVLYGTLPAGCIEKAVCVKTKEELCQKERFTPRLPRVVLKAN